MPRYRAGMREPDRTDPEGAESTAPEAAEWTAWLSDHRTKEWVKAKDAVLVRDPAVQTPMNSGLVAWANAASRDQDPAGKAGTPVAATEVIGPFAPGAK